MAFRGSGSISLEGNSGGQKLLARLTGMFLTDTLWVSVAVSYLAKCGLKMLSTCPPAPESQPWRCVQENLTSGISVPCSGRFSKVFICLKSQNAVHLHKLWSNTQKCLSCLILEPDFLRDAVTLCRNPLTALGTFGNFLLNIKLLSW